MNDLRLGVTAPRPAGSVLTGPSTADSVLTGSATAGSRLAGARHTAPTAGLNLAPYGGTALDSTLLPPRGAPA